MRPVTKFFKKLILFSVVLISANCSGTDIPQLQLEPKVKPLISVIPTPQIIFNGNANILILPVRFRGVVVGTPVVISGTDIAIVEVKITDPNVGVIRMAFVPANYKISNGQTVYLRVVMHSILGGPQSEREYVIEKK
jgi:hypothetical protein